jgi:hypothetical protein
VTVGEQEPVEAGEMSGLDVDDAASASASATDTAAASPAVRKEKSSSSASTKLSSKRTSVGAAGGESQDSDVALTAKELRRKVRSCSGDCTLALS